MKKSLVIVAGLVLAASMTLTGLAIAQTPAPATCSQALDVLAAARTMPVGDVAAKQIVLDQARAAQLQLDKNVADAQKALDANTDPAKVAALQVALNEAKAAQATGQAKVDAAQKALDVDKKLVADRDKAIAAAQAGVDRACGAVTTVPSTPTVTTTVTPPPVTVPVPSSINTGLA